MNSELNNQLKTLEGFEFKFFINQATGLRMLRQLIRSHSAYLALQEIAVASKNEAESVLNRVFDLALLETDQRYEHPYDTALAAYLLILEAAGDRFAEAAVSLLLNTPRLWWAKKVARQIDETVKHRSDSSTDIRVFNRTGAHYCYFTNNNSEAREWYSMKGLPISIDNNVIVLEMDAKHVLTDVEQVKMIWLRPVGYRQLSILAAKNQFVDDPITDSEAILDYVGQAAA